MWYPDKEPRESFGEAAGTGLLMLALCILTIVTLALVAA